MQTLAVVIITLNEERNIQRCLASVKDLADEIIVLDAFSTDQTQAICTSFQVQFHQRKWEGYAASKNYLNSLASSDYILSLDADEAISDALYAELIALKKNGLKGTYALNRMTNYLGKWIKHSGWFPDIKPRLFPRIGSYWSGEFVHEELITPTSAKTVLKGVLAHYSYYSYADHRARADKYSVLTAQKFHAAGKTVGPMKPFISAIGRFIAMYILKLGFLDGWAGFKIAQISAQSNVLKYRELRRLTYQEKIGSSRDWNNKHIVISRTDSIGDVMLTLPMTAWLKDQFPTCHITFLCKNYTAPIVSNYDSVDEILVLDDLEQLHEQAQIDTIKSKHFDAIVHVFPRKSLAQLFKTANVPARIGTAHRIFHWSTCNIRPKFTRKKSPLHEAQLNFELLRPFGLNAIPTFESLHVFTQHFHVPQQSLPAIISFSANSSIALLHPKSQGSAKEWPIENYISLATQLIAHNYTVVFTGTEKEGLLFRHLLPVNDKLIDTTGKLTIDQLQYLIGKAQVLVACSTGPLHIAGFLGIQAIGLFSPKIPIHPGRWKPLGLKSSTLVYDANCSLCSKNEPCNCIEQITVDQVMQRILAQA